MTTKKESLQKLFPKDVKLKLDSINREFLLKKITLNDDSWMLNEFGGAKGLEEVFANSDFRSIIRIFYRLLSEDDKQFITNNIEFKVTDEDGNQLDIKSNIDKLTYMLQTKDILKITHALLEVRGVSSPDLLGSEAGKKKVLKK